MKLYKYWVIRVMPKDGGLSCRTQWCLINGKLQKYVFQIFWVNFDIIFDAPKIIQTIFHIKDIIWCFPYKLCTFLYPWLVHRHPPFNTMESIGLTNNHTVLHIKVQHFKCTFILCLQIIPCDAIEQSHWDYSKYGKWIFYTFG